jgi:hypothetical protein
VVFDQASRRALRTSADRRAVSGNWREPVSVRTFAVSPFPEEAGAVYAGGYDANDTPAHDTAWLARGFIDPR